MFELLFSLLDMPAVSIIVPVYNGEKYIGKAIQSALDQNYSNFEILIINDGSTDNTTNIISSFNSSKIRLINLKNNRGTLYARALGISLAAEFSIFLDSDDELCNNIIDVAVQKQQETNADIVFFASRNIFPLTQKYLELMNSSHNITLTSFDSPLKHYSEMRRISEVVNEDYVKNRYMSEAMSSIEGFMKSIFGQGNVLYVFWSKLFRTAILHKSIQRLNILLANKIVFSEDMLLLSTLIEVDPLVVGIDVVGYQYRENQESITKRSDYNHEKKYDKWKMQDFGRKYADIYFDEFRQKTNLEFRKFRSKQDFKSLHADNCQKQIEILYKLREQETEQRFAKVFYQVCDEIHSFLYNCWVESGKSWDMFRKKNDYFSDFIQYYDGDDSEQIYEREMNLSETMTLVETILSSKESGRLQLQDLQLIDENRTFINIVENISNRNKTRKQFGSTRRDSINRCQLIENYTIISVYNASSESNNVYYQMQLNSDRKSQVIVTFKYGTAEQCVGQISNLFARYECVKNVEMYKLLPKLYNANSVKGIQSWCNVIDQLYLVINGVL